jgi:hypothetical protein
LEKVRLVLAISGAFTKLQGMIGFAEKRSFLGGAKKWAGLTLGGLRWLPQRHA